MKFLIHLFLLTLFLCQTSNSQEIVFTNDGKKVILKEDGTWEFLKEDNKQPSTSGFDFRKTIWGMSKAQVKTTEKGEIKQEDERLLAYTDRVSNKEVYAIYIFAENKLVRAKYLFIDEHSNKNDYIVDYSDIKSTLTQKYGTPIKDDKLWRNDLYKNDYDEWGFAVSLGHLKYFSKWATDNTQIAFMLFGENYKINLVIEYKSLEYASLENKIIKDDEESKY